MNQHMDLDESIPRPLNHYWLVAPVQALSAALSAIRSWRCHKRPTTWKLKTAWREVRNLPGILEKYGSRHRETQVALRSIWTWVLWDLPSPSGLLRMMLCFFLNVFRILLKKQVRPWLPDLIPIVTALRGRPHCLRLQAVHRCSCLWSNKVCRLSTASLSFPVQDKDVMYILYIDLHGSTCSSFSRQDCLFAAFWSAWLVRRLLIVNRWPRHATTRSTCRNYLLPISTFHTFPRLADTSSATQETERLSIKEFWKNFEDLINWDEFWKVFLPPANP